MDALSSILEFIIFVFGSGNIGFFLLPIVATFGFVMGLFACVCIVLALKSTKKNVALGAISSALSVVSLLLLPVFNNAVKGCLANFGTAITYISIYSNYEYYEIGNAVLRSLNSSIVNFITAGLLGLIIFITTVVTIIYLVRCIKNTKYKVFPIVTLALVLLRCLIPCNVMNFGGTVLDVLFFNVTEKGYLFAGFFGFSSFIAANKIMAYEVIYILPFLMLIPYAILNFIKNKKEAK